MKFSKEIKAIKKKMRGMSEKDVCEIQIDDRVCKFRKKDMKGLLSHYLRMQKDEFILDSTKNAITIFGDVSHTIN